MSLELTIEKYFALGADAIGNNDAMTAFLELRAALETGTLRSAEPDAASATGWRVNAWVKRGILLGFRLGQMTEMGGAEGLGFVDKATYPARRFAVSDSVRVVGQGRGRDASGVCERGRLRG